jgi:hypothetical protein
MFDPTLIEKAIVAVLSHPAMAEVTALASIAVSIMQARKQKATHRPSVYSLKKYVSI